MDRFVGYGLNWRKYVISFYYFLYRRSAFLPFRIDNKFIFIVFILLLQTLYSILCTIQSCFSIVFQFSWQMKMIIGFLCLLLCEISLRFEWPFSLLIWKSIMENYMEIYSHSIFNDDFLPKSIYVNKVVVLKTLMVLFNFHRKPLM